MALTVLSVLTSLPGLVAALLLEPTSANIPVLAVCLVPLAPALSATLFAWRSKARTLGASPWSAFWKGYRLSWADSLRVAVPALLVLGALAWTVLNIDAAGVFPGYAWLLLAIGAGVLLIAVQALVISTFFSFRSRDVWRLAVYFVFRRPLVTLAVAALLICVLGVVWLTNEAVAVLTTAVVAAVLLRYEQPVLTDIEGRFVAHGQPETSTSQGSS
jgi:uncharacterized membrane protein YesL